MGWFGPFLTILADSESSQGPLPPHKVSGEKNKSEKQNEKKKT